jgi:hypothetical protein
MTAQFHEKLIFEGEPTSMACCPTIPANHPQVVPGQPGENFTSSTACWRGYIGTWEIRDGKFYLVACRGRYHIEGEPIFADWYSGELRIPDGPMVNYVHMGYGSTYARETFVTIRNGVVVSTRVVKRGDDEQ